MRKLLAFYCRICPLCLVTRAFPRSFFAALARRLERFCPFCRARKALK